MSRSPGGRQVRQSRHHVPYQATHIPVPECSDILSDFLQVAIDVWYTSLPLIIFVIPGIAVCTLGTLPRLLAHVRLPLRTSGKHSQSQALQYPVLQQPLSNHTRRSF